MPFRHTAVTTHVLKWYIIYYFYCTSRSRIKVPQCWRKISKTRTLLDSYNLKIVWTEVSHLTYLYCTVCIASTNVPLHFALASRSIFENWLIYIKDWRVASARHLTELKGKQAPMVSLLLFFKEGEALGSKTYLIQMQKGKK